MSYDLLLHRQSPGSVARDDAEEGRLCPGEVSLERGMLPLALGLAAASVCTGLVAALGGHRGVRRRVERTYYRATRHDLAATQETPAVTMRELVYGPRKNT